jgi:hypothetical protein
MGVNRDTHSPTVQPNIDYDTVLSPTLRGIDVLAPGRLTVVDIEGNTWEHTFLALNPSAAGDEPYSLYPYRLELQIRMIVGDGSGNIGTTTGTDLDISAGEIIGLH